MAETLVEALSNAYLINPVLNAERANLRATDEQVAVAKSGLRPNISASGDAAFQNTETDIAGGSRQQAQQKVQQCDAATAALESGSGSDRPLRRLPTSDHDPSTACQDQVAGSKMLG